MRGRGAIGRSLPKRAARCRKRRRSILTREQARSSHRGRSPRSILAAQPTRRQALVVPILFYRSMLLAADVAPIDALATALAASGIDAVPIFVSSLKDPAVTAFVENAAATLAPAAIVTATAFASGAEPGAETLFDRIGVPVFQVFAATTRREAWENGQRGLAPADLAMHVVLPELDGRILAGAISFKAAARRRRRRSAFRALRQPAGAGPHRAGRRPHRRVRPAAARRRARERRSRS